MMDALITQCIQLNSDTTITCIIVKMLSCDINFNKMNVSMYKFIEYEKYKIDYAGNNNFKTYLTYM